MLRLDQYRFLISKLAVEPVTPATILALRKQVGDELTRELIDIAAVQGKAAKKFGEGIWMATARSIEQASDQVVANYKASLMGDRVVIDLCGGIGGDAMAFAKRGPVITIDRDPRMTTMAAENLRQIKGTSAVVVSADVTTYFRSQQFADPRIGIHIDPDRRPRDRRTTAPEAYEPSFGFVLSVIASSPSSIVKLAPAAVLNEVDSVNTHRQWISLKGSVREQTLLVGDCIDKAELRRGHRSAVRLMRDGTRQVFESTDCTGDREVVRTIDSPLRYIVDFDPAVRASGLSVAFGTQNGLSCLGEPSGFFASDEPPDNRLLMQCFEVTWGGPADIKQIRKQLAQNSARLHSIKVRNTDHDPAALMRSLNAKTSNSHDRLTLLIGRTRKGAYAVLAKQL